MSNAVLKTDAGSVSPHYPKTSRRIQDQLRELLETYHVQSDKPIDLEPQQLDFIWEIENQLGKIEPGTFVDPFSKEEFERDQREEKLSHFNLRFLNLFELIFTYQNCVLENCEELLHGKSRQEVENELKDNLGARQPLWLVVLEVEEKSLNYSILATKDEEGCHGLKEPRNLFSSHRMYDNVDDERDLIDLSHLYAGGQASDTSYLPAVIAVLDDEDVGRNGGPEGACAAWKQRCEKHGLKFNFIGLSRELVEGIDKRLERRLSSIDVINSDENRRIIKEVRAELVGEWEDWSDKLDGFVKLGGDEWFRGHETYKEAYWDEPDADREGVLLYFIWLRSLAIAAGRNEASEPGEGVNFKAYLYFPIPDISGNYVHTITAAFTDWPDPEWVLMVEQQAPKLFQRSGFLLARKLVGAREDDFGHEIGNCVDTVRNVVTPHFGEVKRWLSEDREEEVNRSEFITDKRKVVTSPELFDASLDYIEFWGSPDEGQTKYLDYLEDNEICNTVVRQLFVRGAIIALAREGKSISSRKIVTNAEFIDEFKDNVSIEVHGPTLHLNPDVGNQLKNVILRCLLAAFHNAAKHAIPGGKYDGQQLYPVGIWIDVVDDIVEFCILNCTSKETDNDRNKPFGTKELVNRILREELSGGVQHFGLAQNQSAAKDKMAGVFGEKEIISTSLVYKTSLRFKSCFSITES